MPQFTVLVYFTAFPPHIRLPTKLKTAWLCWTTLSTATRTSTKTWKLSPFSRRKTNHDRIPTPQGSGTEFVSRLRSGDSGMVNKLTSLLKVCYLNIRARLRTRTTFLSQKAWEARALRQVQWNTCQGQCSERTQGLCRNLEGNGEVKC